MRLLVAAWLAVVLACGRVGFDPVELAQDDAAGTVDDGAIGDASGDAANNPDGTATACVYMNCGAGESTCCVGMSRTCEPTDTCAGVQTECNVANGQGCPGPAAQMCCPTGQGGARCTPALCVP